VHYVATCILDIYFKAIILFHWPPLV